MPFDALSMGPPTLPSINLAFSSHMALTVVLSLLAATATATAITDASLVFPVHCDGTNVTASLRTNYVNVSVDHFNPGSMASLTFPLRYLVDDQFFKPGVGPVSRRSRPFHVVSDVHET